MLHEVRRMGRDEALTRKCANAFPKCPGSLRVEMRFRLFNFKNSVDACSVTLRELLKDRRLEKENDRETL